MHYSHDDVPRVPGGVRFNCEPGDGVVLVVLRGGDPAHRWRDATRLSCSALQGLDPARILFVEFDPFSKQFSLLHMRWSERLWSYCYLGASALSEESATALGLTTLYWQRELGRPLRTPAPLPDRVIRN
jgi:hypothetical protein